jgi:hypothetical protein
VLTINIYEIPLYVCRWSVNIGALQDDTTSMDTESVKASSRKKRGHLTSKSKEHASILGEVGILGVAATSSRTDESGAPQRKKIKAPKQSSPAPSKEPASAAADAGVVPAATGGRRGSARSQRKGGGSDSLFSLK